MNYHNIPWIALNDWTDPPSPPYGKIIEIKRDSLFGTVDQYRFVPDESLITESRLEYIHNVFDTYRNRINSNSEWYIYEEQSGRYCLGIRTSGYETDHEYITALSSAEAWYIFTNAEAVFNTHVKEHFSCLTKCAQPNPPSVRDFYKDLLQDINNKNNNMHINTLYYIENGAVKQITVEGILYASEQIANDELKRETAERIKALKEELENLEWRMENLK